MANVGTLPRMSASTLSALLLAQSPSDDPTIAVIDVRDDDHVGGHIRASTHVPSSTLDDRVPELVRKLKDKDTVVFHCALSQQRGPNAALKYVRERERLLGATPRQGAITTSVGEIMKKSAAESKEKKGNIDQDSGREDGWDDVKSPEEESTKKKEQKVYVLDRGFVGWQELYGEDDKLTEGYVKDIWKDGYWM